MAIQNTAQSANRVSSIKNIPDSIADLAYLAGILDGEGTICIRENAQGRRYAMVWIYNTDVGLMTWLKSIGGSVAEMPPKEGGLQKLMMYQWRLQSNQDILPLLTAIEPYLRIKHQKAVEAISLAKLWLADQNRKQAENLIRTRTILKYHRRGINPYRISFLAGCSRHTVVRTLEREGLR